MLHEHRFFSNRKCTEYERQDVHPRPTVLARGSIVLSKSFGDYSIVIHLGYRGCAGEQVFITVCCGGCTGPREGMPALFFYNR